MCRAYEIKVGMSYLLYFLKSVRYHISYIYLVGAWDGIVVKALRY